METRRFGLFLVLAMLIMVAWMGVYNWLFPPPPPRPAAKLPSAAAAAARKAGALALALAPGGLPAAELTDLADPPTLERKSAELRSWLAKQALARQEEVRPAVKEEPDEELPLGNSTDYRLRATVSKQGAAIRRITLNTYHEASWNEALPVYERDGKTPKPLTLVSDDEDGRLAGLGRAERLGRQSFRLAIGDQPLVWQVKHRAIDRLTFEAAVAAKNLRVQKTFTLKPGDQHIGLELSFEPLDPAQKAEFSYDLFGPRGIPVEGIYWKQQSWRQVVIGTADAQNERTRFRYVRDPEKIDPDRGKKPDPPGLVEQDLQYAGVMVQFFAALAVIDGDPSRNRYIEKVVPEYLGDDLDYPPRSKPFQGKVTTRLTSKPIRVEANKLVEHRYLLYAGPVKVSLLGYEAGVPPELVRKYTETLRLDTLTDYPSDFFLARAFAKIGWTSLLVFFTNLMHWLLETLSALLSGVPGRYGLAIILLTVIVRACLFPISRKQTQMSKKMQERMAVLKPELQKIQEKYKNDPQERQRAQMEVYRKHGVSPLSGCAGCLPALLQLPVFLGLYYALNESVHLRLKPFLWAENLAAPDMLFNWAGWPVFGWLAGFLNLGPYLHLLPFLSVALMIIHQKVMTPPTMDEQQAMQMKMMNYMMPVFGYLFYWVASGLCIYFTMSSAWALLERRLIHKPADKPPGGPETPARLSPKSPNGDRGRGGKPSSRTPERDGRRSRLGELWQNLLKQAEKK